MTTPQPPAGDPFGGQPSQYPGQQPQYQGQPQQYQGEQPQYQGQQPSQYPGQQPQYQGQPQQYQGEQPQYQGQQPPVAPVPVKKRRAARILIKIAGFLVIAVIVAVVGAYMSRDEPSNTKVGECLTGQDANKLKKVACDDAKATYKVVGRIENKTQAEVKPETTCADYPTADMSFWQGKEGEAGYVLCLEPIKK